MSVIIVDLEEKDRSTIERAIYCAITSADKKLKRAITGSLFAFHLFPSAQDRLKAYCDIQDQWDNNLNINAIINEVEEMANEHNRVVICVGPEHFHSSAEDYKYRVMTVEDIPLHDPCTDQKPDKTATGAKVIERDKHVDVPNYIMKEAMAVMNSFLYLYKHTDIFTEDEYHEACQKYRRFISYLINNSDEYAEVVTDGDVMIMAGFKFAYIHNDETHILEHWENGTRP